jgi:hypothetical protein
MSDNKPNPDLQVLRDAALRYGRAGLKIFPIREGTKDQPLMKEWGLRASSDEAQIAKWWATHPSANIGLACMPSGLLVVDIDVKNGAQGRETMAALLDDLYVLTPTRALSTPSGGEHDIYKGKAPSSQGRIGPGVDTRGTGATNGGYTLLPPSRTPEGSYEWTNKSKIAPLDPWVKEKLAAVESAGEASQDFIVEPDEDHNIRDFTAYLDDAPRAVQGDGGEARTLSLIAGRAKDFGLSPDMAFHIIYNSMWNLECSPPWSDGDELRKKIENAYNYLKQEPPGSKAVEPAKETFSAEPLTADEMAAWEKNDSDFRQGVEASLVPAQPGDPEPKKRASEFWAYLPEHKYIYMPTGDLWPSESVNNSTKKGTSGWLDKNRAVHQMTWWPGQPQIIADRLVIEGGFTDKPGANTFNRYKEPPKLKAGDAHKADRWRAHIRMLYATAEAEHIENWLAYKVQNPGKKINHALVLGGPMRTGKDTILNPVRVALGEWNFRDETAVSVMADEKNNGFLEKVVLRISEIHAMAKDRYSFYARSKSWLASPPETMSVADKWVKAHPVLNVVAIVMTINKKAGEMFLPPDDGRHYVAWSNVTRAQIDADDPLYHAKLYAWLANGGNEHVAAWLHGHIIPASFSPTSPPPLTAAFHEIANASASPDDDELAEILDHLDKPVAVTVAQIIHAAHETRSALDWSSKNTRASIPRQFEGAGYVPIIGPMVRGRWSVNKKRVMIYGRADKPLAERIAAARVIAAAAAEANDDPAKDFEE